MAPTEYWCACDELELVLIFMTIWIYLITCLNFYIFQHYSIHWTPDRKIIASSNILLRFWMWILLQQRPPNVLHNISRSKEKICRYTISTRFFPLRSGGRGPRGRRDGGTVTSGSRAEPRGTPREGRISWSTAPGRFLISTPYPSFTVVGCNTRRRCSRDNEPLRISIAFMAFDRALGTAAPTRLRNKDLDILGIEHIF